MDKADDAGLNGREFRPKSGIDACSVGWLKCSLHLFSDHSNMGLSENCLKIGYIPNEIAIFHRDNDQQNQTGFRGLAYFQTHPYLRIITGDLRFNLSISMVHKNIALTVFFLALNQIEELLTHNKALLIILDELSREIPGWGPFCKNQKDHISQGQQAPSTGDV